MTISESNKLIADFMGWNYNKEDGFYFTPYSVRVIDEYESIDGRAVYDNELPIELLQFHTSWDWLMPVVERIETDVLEGDVIFTIDGDNVFIEYSMEYRVNVYGYTKLESVYKAVIDFIKWYNENKQS